MYLTARNTPTKKPTSFILINGLTQLIELSKSNNLNSGLSTKTISAKHINQKRMKILAHIPLYFPNHCSGAEATALALFNALRERGHEIRINVDRKTVDYHGGFQITDYNFLGGDKKALVEMYKWADVIYTHLGSIGFVDNIIRTVDRPVVYYAHNSHRSSAVARRKWVNVVYNSEWVKDELKQYYPTHNNIVCRPLIEFDGLKKTIKGDRITLINANENKGGKQFIEIARMMPKEKFLIVEGSYGDQHTTDLPDNVEVMKNTSDINEAYQKSKIVLMPSLYESFGRVAIEASWLGIPVISTATKGLVEAMGSDGNYCMRNDIQAWVDEIKRINKNYAAESEKAKQIGVNSAIKLTNDKEKFCKFVENITA